MLCYVMLWANAQKVMRTIRHISILQLVIFFIHKCLDIMNKKR